MLAQITLRQRIQLLAITLAVGLLVVGIVGPLAVRERDAAARDVRVRIEPMRQLLGDLQLSLLDQESAVRGFILTGDAASLALYQEAMRVGESTLARLETLSADDPVLSAEIREVRDAVGVWHSEVAERDIQLVQEGRTDDAVAFEQTGASRAVFDDVRAKLSDLRARLLAENRAADQRVADTRARLTVLLWLLAGAGGGLVVLTGVLLRRWIGIPLVQISQAVEAVTRGDRERRIPSPGPPDIAALGANVEAMRAETVRRLNEAVRAREALQQQGPAVVTLRAELAADEFEPPPGLRVATTFLPAQGDLAGDWYQWVRLGPRQAGLMMVDVSGHGPDAGVFALRVKHLLTAVLRDEPPPADALTWLAERIGETGERFLTGLVLEVDAASGVVRYANAGHPPPLVVRPGVEWLDPTGPLLGPLPGSWHTAELKLLPGALLVAYTDGLIEARDERGRSFGEDRVVEALEACTGGPDEAVSLCVERVRAFSGDRIGDDLTIVALEVERAP